jgi:hypothetical protein
MGAHLRWVPGAPSCIWTFLSSLGKNESFSIVLKNPNRKALPISFLLEATHAEVEGAL